eukprot:3512266-Rhodomonas_salina.3
MARRCLPRPRPRLRLPDSRLSRVAALGARQALKLPLRRNSYSGGIPTRALISLWEWEPPESSAYPGFGKWRSPMQKRCLSAAEGGWLPPLVKRQQA